MSGVRMDEGTRGGRSGSEKKRRGGKSKTTDGAEGVRVKGW